MLLTFCKNRIYCYLLFLCFCFQTSYLYGQNSDSKEKAIDGLDFGILPSFVYNTDKGLQYGALANFYYYGKKTLYPNYLFNLYLQSSRTTRKGYVNFLFFDSSHLLPNDLRLTIDMSLEKRGFQQFYGFNGYNSLYSGDYIDQRKSQFISRHYYFMDERSRTITIDVKGKLLMPHFIWDLGLGYYNISTSPFHTFHGIEKKQPTLFEKYIAQGVIPKDQKDGGITTYIKTGLIYDTRDNEAIPKKGLWIEAIYLNAPSFFANKFAYSQFTLIYNQYVSINPQLVFAYRLAFQNKIEGDMPVYMMPYLISTYRNEEALGGNKTIRGILNQRLLGEGYCFGNFEFRYIPINTNVLNRNLNIGFNFFEDMGMITDNYEVDKSLNGSLFDYKPGQDRIHSSVGAGVRFIINHNFIVAYDYGRVLDKRDGTGALYIDLDYLF